MPDANILYCGDNLDVLRKIRDNSVDLIYLDPPFNTKKDYVVVVRDRERRRRAVEIAGFDDRWKWDGTCEDLRTEFRRADYKPELRRALDAFHLFLGDSGMMAYLVTLAVRLWELRRILKPTGTLYLHCDPHASHYLKILLDVIFGSERFLSEVIWKRTYAQNRVRKWGPIHDVILVYTKGRHYTWNPVFCPYDEKYLKGEYRHKTDDGRAYRITQLTHAGLVKTGSSSEPWRGFDPSTKGRHWAVPRRIGQHQILPHSLPVQEALDRLDEMGRIHWPSNGGWPSFKVYLDEMEGRPIQSIIVDIPPIVSTAKERTGYPTQKPIALLERIIKASSNQGDIVLDPFCGAGTTVAAAEKLGRRWIGIEKNPVAVDITEKRLAKEFPQAEYKTIRV